MAIQRKGKVYYNDIYAGLIYENETEYVFEYDNSYNGKPISLTMPITSTPYRSNILFPFFDGLIPEGWLLEIAYSKFNIDIRDRFNLLLNFCNDCIGAVSIINASEEE